MQRLIARARSSFDRSFSDRIASLGRDLAMLVGPKLPRPVVRNGTAKAPDAFTRGSRWLRVVEVTPAARDAVMIVFEPGLDAWQPGQFLTLTVEVGGARLKRAYSLCTRHPAPGAVPRGPAIVVKRVPEGRASNWLVDHAAPGMLFEVRGPSGQFVLPPRTREREVLLIGGGSGITPLVALAEELIAAGDRATLVYGNRALADVIFFDRLAAMVVASGGRFVVRHFLETPPAGWDGGVGRLSAETLLRAMPSWSSADPGEVFSCGPAPMMDAVRVVVRERLHEERFQSLGDKRVQSTTAQPLRIALGGHATDVIAKPGATLLEAGLAAGLPMPYSCTMGGCGACKVHVHGEVVHDEPNGLSAEEAAAGHAFACIARPLGPCVIEVPQ